MRVMVTGAYGLIGSAVLARLHGDGHELVALGRNVTQARVQAPFARWIEADFRRMVDAENWLAVLQGIDAVVNCVGVLQDGAGDDVVRVQATATIALFAACERAGVRRVIHISAVGADRTAPTPFARSKAEAEDDLVRRNLEWAVLRPALVLAPAVYGGTAMLRGLAGMPFVAPLVAADARIQVVGVDDVTETVSRCLVPHVTLKVRWDLAHPRVLALGEIVAAIRGWLGFSTARSWRVPRVLTLMVARAADALGYLGWRSPARSTAMRQLAAGVVGDPQDWMAATGIAPQSFEDILAARPAGVQERWFARLFLLKPLAVGGLALFWVLTGLVTLGPGRDAAMAHLSAARFPPALAVPTFWLGAWFDVVLGLALLVRPITRQVLYVMLIGTVFYLAIGTALSPQLWSDPLGPFLKIIPMLIATLFTLAILDER